MTTEIPDELTEYEQHEHDVLDMTTWRGSVVTTILGHQVDCGGRADFAVAEVLQNLDWTLWKIGRGADPELEVAEFRKFQTDLAPVLDTAGFDARMHTVLVAIYDDGLREARRLGRTATAILAKAA